MPTTKTKVTTLDAWVGPNTKRIVTLDAVVGPKRFTKSTTLDAYIARRKSVTLDAYISDPRGSYRGAMLQSARDALPALSPQDTVTVLDADPGSPAQYWTGAQWVPGVDTRSPESGVTKKWVIPVSTGRWWEFGDPTYPSRYWDGGQMLYWVDSAGNVQVTSLSWGDGNAKLLANDTIELPTAAGYNTPAIVQNPAAAKTNSGTSLTATAWSPATTAGNVLIASFSWSNGNTPVTPTGWTLARLNVLSTVCSAAIYYKLAAGSDAAPQLTFSGSPTATSIECQTLEVSGLQAVVDNFASNSSTSASTCSSGTTAQTVQGAEFWIGAIHRNSTHALSAPTNGFSRPSSSDATTTTATQAVAYKIVSGLGQATFSMTADDSVAYVSNIVTFKASTVTVAAPSSGLVRLYGKSIGGTTHAVWKTPDNLEFGGNFHGAKYLKNGNQAITSQTSPYTQVTSWTSEFDTDGILVSNQLKVPTGMAGYWFVWCKVLWDNFAVTGLRDASFFKNGTQKATVRMNQGASINDQVFETVFKLAVGDTVDLRVAQNSGGNLNVTGANTENAGSAFGMYFLAPG